MKKPLILLAFALLLFLILFAFIKAFESNKPSPAKNNKANTMLLQNVNSDTKLINPELQSLPQSYADTETIKKYLGNKEKDDTLKSLQTQLEELKSESENLRQELSKNTVRTPPPAPPSEQGQNQQANSSGMFFSGIAPQVNDATNKDNSPAAYSGTSDNQTSTNTTAGLKANQTDLQIQKLPATAQKKFYGQQALQAQKIAVLKATDNVEDIYDLHNIVSPASPYEIQAGAIIPAMLMSGVNTSVAGTVVAQVRNDMYDSVKGKHLLIPKGSKIIGEYEAKTSYGQRRVLIAFTRIIRPDGSSILVGKPNSADLQGGAGVEGKVDNHWGQVLGAATMSTILSVGAGVVSDNSSNPNKDYRSSRQNAILGASGGISQVGQSLTERALKVEPTITIPAGFQFTIVVRRDMILTPYTGSGE